MLEKYGKYYISNIRAIFVILEYDFQNNYEGLISYNGGIFVVMDAKSAHHEFG